MTIRNYIDNDDDSFMFLQGFLTSNYGLAVHNAINIKREEVMKRLEVNRNTMTDSEIRSALGELAGLQWIVDFSEECRKEGEHL